MPLDEALYELSKEYIPGGTVDADLESKTRLAILVSSSIEAIDISITSCT